MRREPEPAIERRRIAVADAERLVAMSSDTKAEVGVVALYLRLRRTPLLGGGPMPWETKSKHVKPPVQTAGRAHQGGQDKRSRSG